MCVIFSILSFTTQVYAVHLSYLDNHNHLHTHHCCPSDIYPPQGSQCDLFETQTQACL